MLVRCSSCNKPVFVSSSAVAGGDARVACKACKTQLIVTKDGGVSLADASAAAAAAPAATLAPAIAAPVAPEAVPATPAPTVAPAGPAGTAPQPHVAPGEVLQPAPIEAASPVLVGQPAAATPAPPLAAEVPATPTGIPSPTPGGDAAQLSPSPFGAGAPSGDAASQVTPSPFSSPTTEPAWQPGELESGQPATGAPHVGPVSSEPVPAASTSGNGALFQPGVTTPGVPPAQGTPVEVAAPGMDEPTQIGPLPGAQSGFEASSQLVAPSEGLPPGPGFADMPDAAEAVTAVGPMPGAEVPTGAPYSAEPGQTASESWASSEAQLGGSGATPDAGGPSPAGAQPQPGAPMTSVGGEPVPGVEGEPLPSIEAQPLLEGEPLPDVEAQPLLAHEGQAVAGDAMGTPELLDVTAPAPMPEGPLLEEGATIEESAPLQPLATAEPELELEMEPLSPVEAEPVGLSAELLDDDLHDIGVPKKGGAFKYVAILILLAVLGGAAAWALGLLEIPGLEPPAATARLLGRQEPPDQLVTSLQPVADDTTAGVVVDAGSESAAAADVAGSGTEADTGTPGDTELADHGTDASAEDAGEPEPEPAVEPEPEPEPAVEPEPEPTKKPRQRKRKRRGSRIRKPPKRPSPVKKPAAGGGADEHYAAAVGYVKQKKPTKAIDELKKAIKANSRHAKSYRLLGMAFKMIGQEKKAIQAWERFVKLDPGHADSAKLRAIIADYYKRNPR